MGKLRDRLEEIRQKPHAVRERYAVLASIVLVALVLGSWYGIRTGIEVRREAASDLNADNQQSPFRIVGNAWEDFRGYLGNVSGELPDFSRWFDPKPDTASTTASDQARFGLEETSVRIPDTAPGVSPDGSAPSELSPEEKRAASERAAAAYGIDTVPTTSQDE